MRYLATRAGFYLLAVWGSLTINFLLPRLAPGDPATSLLERVGNQLTPQQIDALRTVYGISHASLWSQYGSYLADLAHGDLGISITYFPTPVSQVVRSAIGWTVLLGLTSLLVGFAIGVGLGIVVAWRRAGRVDSLATPFFVFLGAVPYFWLAMATLYVFGLRLRWLPISHAYSSFLAPSASAVFVSDVANHLILPAGTIVAASIGGWLIVMRSTMVSVLSEDYITMATAKGLRPLRVALSYGARNALLPTVTSGGIALGFIVSGALLTEIVFSYPGLGYLMYNAVESLDYPLLQGLLLVITVGVLAVNLLVDVVLVALDPRIRRA
jgi:peptide/nickel transport system permease protein